MISSFFKDQSFFQISDISSFLDMKKNDTVRTVETVRYLSYVPLFPCGPNWRQVNLTWKVAV